MSEDCCPGHADDCSAHYHGLPDGVTAPCDCGYVSGRFVTLRVAWRVLVGAIRHPKATTVVRSGRR